MKYSVATFVRMEIIIIRSALGIEPIYLRQWCFDASKLRVAASTGAQYGFARRNKIRVTLWEKAIWFRHPDYDLDRAQKLISSPMSRPTPVDTQNVIEIHARVFQ